MEIVLKEDILSCGGSEAGDLIMNKSYDSPISQWEKYFSGYEIGDGLSGDC